MYRANTWKPYWDGRTRWILLVLYQQKGLFLPERLSCVRLQVLLSKWSGSVDSCILLNSSVNKILPKRTIQPREKTPILFWTSLATIYHEGVFRWWQYSKQKFFTIKNSFGTFKACFRYLQRAMDINTSTSFIFLLNITQQFWNIEEGDSRTEPWLNMNLEKRAKPATSSLSFKRVLNEKKVTDIRNILTLFFE